MQGMWKPPQQAPRFLCVSKSAAQAKEVFGVDSIECELPVPERLCHMCYNVLVHTQKVRQEGRYYEH